MMKAMNKTQRMSINLQRNHHRHSLRVMEMETVTVLQRSPMVMTIRTRTMAMVSKTAMQTKRRRKTRNVQTRRKPPTMPRNQRRMEMTTIQMTRETKMKMTLIQPMTIISRFTCQAKSFHWMTFPQLQDSRLGGKYNCVRLREHQAFQTCA